MTRNEFLENRRSGVGSSDVAPILGLSPHRTAIDVYLEKINPPGVAELAPQLEWGQRLEPVIASAIIDHYGWPLAKPTTMTHGVFPFLIASPDRINADGELIEIKTSRFGQGWGEPETADIPDHYWLQVQHLLEVVPDGNVCWVFVLIGGNDFRRYRVEHDPAYLGTVIEQLNSFWECVQTRTPPEPDWSHAATLDAVRRLYPVKAGTEITLRDDAVSLAAERYDVCGAEMRDLQKKRDSAKAQLIAAMGTAEVAHASDGFTMHRKTVHRAGYTVQPTNYETFTIKLAKANSE